MTDTKFRQCVREIAETIRNTHKWRKAELFIVNRHYANTKFACMMMSQKRVWWFFNSRLPRNVAYLTSIAKQLQQQYIGDEYKFMGIVGSDELVAPANVARTILDVNNSSVTIKVTTKGETK